MLFYVFKSRWWAEGEECWFVCCSAVAAAAAVVSGDGEECNCIAGCTKRTRSASAGFMLAEEISVAAAFEAAALKADVKALAAQRVW